MPDSFFARSGTGRRTSVWQAERVHPMERQAPGVRAIFDQAREIHSHGERTAFLDRACAGAPDIRGEVEALLRAGDEAGSFLETPAAGRLPGELAARLG